MVALCATPIAVSIVAATITAHVLPRPHSAGWLAGWWIAVLAVPIVILRVAGRFAPGDPVEDDHGLSRQGTHTLSRRPQVGKHAGPRPAGGGSQDARDRGR